MATVRLFAHLREIAGTSRIDLEGSTVGEVLDRATARFGDAFGAGLATAAVWRNGDSANREDPVEPGDELAVIPPVSGGSDAMARSSLDPSVLTGIIALLLLIGTNLANGPAWWAAALVAVAAAWAIDLANRLEMRGREVATYGVLAVLALTAVLTHVLGGVGLGMTLFLAVAVILGWGVAFSAYRRIEAVAPAVVVALIAGSAVGSLMLTRTVYEPGEHAISVLLLVVSVTALVGWVLDHMRTPVLDPYSGAALVSVISSGLGALIWREDIVGYLLVGLGLAVGLVAGRSFGSILRTGRLALSEQPPGAMTTLDGAILAAALYYPLVSLAL